VGNTDEMLTTPESLEEFASQSPKLPPLSVIAEMPTLIREALGKQRLAWLCLSQILPSAAVAPPSGEPLTRQQHVSAAPR